LTGQAKYIRILKDLLLLIAVIASAGFGKKGHVTADIGIIFTIVTRLEVSALNAGGESLDPDAFIVMQSIKDTRGGMIKKRPLK
jgi:uncharacterized membrane-anchored protein YitT (DUF2179 family)